MANSCVAYKIGLGKGRRCPALDQWHQVRGRFGSTAGLNRTIMGNSNAGLCVNLDQAIN